MFNIHPLIRNEMLKLRNAVLSDNAASECHGKFLSDLCSNICHVHIFHLLYLAGSADRKFSSVEASSSSGICNQHVEHLDSCDISEFDGGKQEQLAKGRSMGVLELNPEDEVEGEIIFHQHRLLCNLVARKCISGLYFAPFCSCVTSFHFTSFFYGTCKHVIWRLFS